MLDKAKIKELLPETLYLVFWDDDDDYKHLQVPKMLTGLAKVELEEKAPKHIKLKVPMSKIAEFVTPDSENNYLVPLAQMLEKNNDICAYGFIVTNGNERRDMKITIWGTDNLTNACNGALEIAKDTTAQEIMECKLLKKLAGIK